MFFYLFLTSVLSLKLEECLSSHARQSTLASSTALWFGGPGADHGGPGRPVDLARSRSAVGPARFDVTLCGGGVFGDRRWRGGVGPVVKRSRMRGNEGRVALQFAGG